jgi:hypothetical protein
MMAVAAKYGKDVHHIHKLFYGVSCNYARLISYLDNENNAKNIKEMTKVKLAEHKKIKKEVKPWETLEDLALKGSKDTDAYKYVLSNRTAEDIAERKRFLELSD